MYVICGRIRAGQRTPLLLLHGLNVQMGSRGLPRHAKLAKTTLTCSIWKSRHKATYAGRCSTTASASKVHLIVLHGGGGLRLLWLVEGPLVEGGEVRVQITSPGSELGFVLRLISVDAPC